MMSRSVLGARRATDAGQEMDWRGANGFFAPSMRRLAGTMDILKVSAQSKPKSVAGALAAVMRDKGGVEIQAVGAGAVNQAVKAIAIARGYVASNGIDLVCIPAFAEIVINGEERTAIRFIVEGRQGPAKD